MIKVERQVLHHCYSQAKIMFKQGDKDKTRDYLDLILVYVARKKQEGLEGEDLIEDVKVNLWLDRAWLLHEKFGTLL